MRGCHSTCCCYTMCCRLGCHRRPSEAVAVLSVHATFGSTNRLHSTGLGEAVEDEAALASLFASTDDGQHEHYTSATCETDSALDVPQAATAAAAEEERGKKKREEREEREKETLKRSRTVTCSFCCGISAGARLE